MDTDEDGTRSVSECVIGCAFRVANGLGSGFLEKVYENALAHEMRKCRLALLQQHAMAVQYDGINVGDYTADIVVEGGLLVELKCVRALDHVDIAQCIIYLKATGLHLCLLLNFGTPRL